MDTRHCLYCRDNFYNSANGMNGKCWSLAEAKLVSRIGIGHWENPPYKKKKVRVPSCWHGQGSDRTHYIDPAALDADGFWKR